MNNIDIKEDKNIKEFELSSSIHLSSIPPLEKAKLVKPNHSNIKSDIEMNEIDYSSKQNKPFGNYRIILFKDGEPSLVMPRLFPICFILNSIFPIFSLYFLYGSIVIFQFILGIPIAIIQISAFTYSCLINPGLPKAEYKSIIYEERNNNYRQCKDCKMWINTEEGTQHCNICNICIEGYDHHCSLMNTCIGKNNLKTFYLYVLFTFLMIIYFVIGFLTHSNVKHNL